MGWKPVRVDQIYLVWVIYILGQVWLGLGGFGVAHNLGIFPIGIFSSSLHIGIFVGRRKPKLVIFYHSLFLWAEVGPKSKSCKEYNDGSWSRCDLVVGVCKYVEIYSWRTFCLNICVWHFGIGKPEKEEDWLMVVGRVDTRLKLGLWCYLSVVARVGLVKVSLALILIYLSLCGLLF